MACNFGSSIALSDYSNGYTYVEYTTPSLVHVPGMVRLVVFIHST